MREDSGEVQLSVSVISGEIKRLSTVSMSILPGTAVGMFACANDCIREITVQLCTLVWHAYLSMCKPFVYEDV